MDSLHDNYFDTLKAYSETLYNRNLKVFNLSETKAMNYVHDVFFIGFDDVNQAKQIIRDRIIHDKRTLIANAQKAGDLSFDRISKKCNGPCGKEKPVTEFSPRIDKPTGYRYYNNLCKECERTRCRNRRLKTLKQTV